LCPSARCRAASLRHSDCAGGIGGGMKVGNHLGRKTREAHMPAETAQVPGHNIDPKDVRFEKGVKS